MKIKITDEELIAAIWENQIRRLPMGVIQRYINGNFGLCRDDGHSFLYASSEHITSRQRITKRISYKHLRNRISRLAGMNMIHSVYGNRLLTFCINSEIAKEAFKDAREYWLGVGVPEGWDNDKNCMHTASVDDIDSLAAQCESILVEKYVPSAITQEVT